MVVCSRKSISIVSLLILNWVSRAHHQRCSPVLFGITLPQLSSKNIIFQISILCSRIEIIEFFSILRNHTIYNQFGDFSALFLRYTEIWSDDEGSKSIKLADPKLSSYYRYPELILVDTQFCVNP